MLDAWAAQRIDALRIRRLVLAGCFGAAVICLAGYAASQKSSAAPEPPPEEKLLEVTLLDPPPPDEPNEPPVEAPTEPEDGAPAEPAAPAAPAIVTPVQVPTQLRTQAPESYDNDKPTIRISGNGDGTGQGTGTGTGSGNGTGSGPPQKPTPRPDPPALPKKPDPPKETKPASTEHDPPVCKRRGIDAAKAKSLGVAGKVVVTYTVTITGAVTNVSAVSGPAALYPLAVAAVSSWKCEPARTKADGKPIAVTKKVPLTVSVEARP